MKDSKNFRMQSLDFAVLNIRRLSAIGGILTALAPCLSPLKNSYNSLTMEDQRDLLNAKTCLCISEWSSLVCNWWEFLYSRVEGADPPGGRSTVCCAAPEGGQALQGEGQMLKAWSLPEGFAAKKRLVFSLAVNKDRSGSRRRLQPAGEERKKVPFLYFCRLGSQ
jgi:hypothetical protein